MSTNDEENNVTEQSNTIPSNSAMRNTRSKKSTSSYKFKGSTAALNGHVFLTPAESKDPKLFERTLEEIKRYADITFTTGASDLAPLFTDELNEPSISKPKPLPDAFKNDEVEIKLWEMDLKAYVKKRDALQRNLYSLYSLVWGQCSTQLQAKLQSVAEFESIKATADVVRLLREIRKVSWSMDRGINPVHSFSTAYRRFISLRQRQGVTIAEHYKNFKTLMDIVEHFAGETSYVPSKLIEAEKTEMAAENEDIGEIHTSEEILTEATRRAKNRLIAMQFLLSGDYKIYSSLWMDYEVRQSRGFDEYPRDLTNAYKVMVEHEKKVRRVDRGRQHYQDKEQQGAVFVTAGTDGHTYRSITCHKCKKKGHYAPKCPGIEEENKDTNEANVTLLNLEESSFDEEEGSDMVFMTVHQEEVAERVDAVTNEFGITLLNGEKAINPQWVLLDTCSTVSLFSNEKLVTNIRPCNKGNGLITQSIGGSMRTKLVADLPNFGEVWFNPQSMANILSFAHVSNRFRITCDTEVEKSFTVHADRGPIVFKELKNGLYYYDTTTGRKPKSSLDYLFFLDATVEERQNQFTKREVEKAKSAIRFYHRVGTPGFQHFIDLLNMSYFRNCEITAADVKRAEYIFGQDLFSIKAKTVRVSTDAIQVTQPYVPEAILQFHRDVHLCVDIMHVQGSAFLVTVSKHLQFRTVHELISKDRANIAKALKDVINIYIKGGYRVVVIFADNAFNCVTNDVDMPTMNICATNEHVPEVERTIRTIKERVRARIHTLKYNRLPKIVVSSLIKQAVINLNNLPSTSGVSKTLSPSTIITGRASPDYNRIRLDFGTYCQVHDEPNPSNTMRSRTTGAIALHESGNHQGSYYFMSLRTGKLLHRRNYTTLPLSNDIIDRVHAIAADENQPILSDHCPVFEFDIGSLVLDSDDDDVDSSAITFDTPEAVVPDIAVPPTSEEIPQIDHNDLMQTPTIDDDEERSDVTETNIDMDSDHDMEEYEERNTDTDMVENEERPVTFENEERPVNENEERSDNENEERPVSENEGRSDNANEERHENTEPSASSSNRVLRPRTGRVYNKYPSDDYVNVPNKPANGYNLLCITNMMKTTTGIILSTIGSDQLTGSLAHKDMPAQKAIKVFGKKAIVAVIEEFRQIHGKAVVKPRKSSELTREEKLQALRAIVLVKQKRCGRFKARTVADGRPQKFWTPKEQTMSSAASSEATSLTLMVDAHEKRDVAILDVPGAYLHATMKDFVILRLEGTIVEYMVEACPEIYKPFVEIINGKKVLYLQLLKALYGCVQSALLWYELFSSTLEKEGFVINPVEPCVANKIINGKVCTVLWYVDDVKISHVESRVVTEVIQMLEQRFGALTVNRGKSHVYLGMNIDFKEDGTVHINMKDHLLEAIHDFGENTDRRVSSPAAHDLFETYEGSSPLLSKDKQEIFHSVTMKLSYVATRARPDIKTALSYLCKRVLKPNEKDWKKLKRVLRFVSQTIDDPLILGADSLDILLTWVDASFAIHPENMRSHTGGCMTYGTGILQPMSKEQKMNVRSSTEAETTGASDYLPKNLWTQTFMKHQMLPVKCAPYYQDNMSAEKIERNGWKSVGSRSRHIDIKTFFVTDRHKKGDISIEHCPTSQMVADYFTKPLQGTLFQDMRDVIMGKKSYTSLEKYADTDKQPEERVGNIIKLQTDMPVTKTDFGAKSYKEVLMTSGSKLTMEKKNDVT